MSNARLQYTQVKNPKLPKTDLVRAKPAPFWEVIGLAWCALVVGFILMIPIMLGLDAAFLGGVGLDGDDELSAAQAWLTIAGGGVLAGTAWFMARYGLPKMLPPLEFQTSEQRDAYDHYHSLSGEDQRDITSAYRAFMNTDGERSSNGAYQIWWDTRHAIAARAQLKEPQVPALVDPFLEDAAHTLEQIRQDVAELQEIRARELS